MDRHAEPRTDSVGVSRSRLACSAALVALVAIVYGTTARRAFIDFDTFQYLTGNPHVSSGVSSTNTLWALTTFEAANWHPLTWLSHQLDVQLLGMSRWAHHLANAAWHAANCVLLFLLLARWTSERGRSLFVAAVFAVHPLHVESVAWIVERKDLLSTFFGFASLHAWTTWTSSRSRVGYGLALVLFALALMSKPMLVTLPFAMLLFDAWPLERADVGWRARVVEKLPFLGLSLASCGITIAAQRAGGALQGLDTSPLASRVTNTLVSYATYLRKAIWPDDLAIFYPLPATPPSATTLVISIAVLALLALVAWLARKRSPAVAVGLLFFLGTLVPVIGLVQVGGQALADRYMYLPLVGLLVAITWGIPWPPRFVRVTSVAAFAIVVVACIFTRRQIGFWRDTQTLCARALEVTEGNYRAHAMLGHSLVAEGDVDLGLAHLYAALRMAPGDLEAQDDLGVALAKKHRLREAEISLRSAVTGNPRRARFVEHLAALLADTGRLDEALSLSDRVIALEPDRATAHYTRAVALERVGRANDARIALERALELAPDDLRARVDLARLSIDANDLDAASQHVDAALALDARNAQALQQRARVETARGQTSAAILDLKAALASRPSWSTAQIDLAWLLATAGDVALREPARAVELADQAVHAGNEQRADYFDVLAAAFASDKRFLEAVAAADRALELANAVHDAALSERIAQRLAAYRRGAMDLAVPR